jgi:hypothetical protein
LFIRLLFPPLRHSSVIPLFSEAGTPFLPTKRGRRQEKMKRKFQRSSVPLVISKSFRTFHKQGG